MRFLYLISGLVLKKSKKVKALVNFKNKFNTITLVYIVGLALVTKIFKIGN